MATLLQHARHHLTLPRPARLMLRGDSVRAGADVARQGQRKAPGAGAQRSPGASGVGGYCAGAVSGRSRVRTKIGGQPRPARSRALEDV